MCYDGLLGMFLDTLEPNDKFRFAHFYNYCRDSKIKASKQKLTKCFNSEIGTWMNNKMKQIGIDTFIKI